MGGKDGSRGYLYQTFASIFQALCLDNWDKIYVEYNSENDKVDIALERNGNAVKSIQVKSSVNSFDRSAIIEWTNDLIKDDIGATECELFLIGQLAPSAIKFKNAIVVLQENNNDKTKLGNEYLKALSNFDISIIKGKILRIMNYPFDLSILTDLLIASLLKYLSIKGFALMYDQLELIAKAIVTDNFLSSISNTGIEKSIFVNYKYQLMLEAPLSIAFATGRILDPKSRISAFPSNPDPLHKSEIWNIEDSYDATFIDFDVRDERIDINESDTCLIVSITRNIEDNVNEQDIQH